MPRSISIRAPLGILLLFVTIAISPCSLAQTTRSRAAPALAEGDPAPELAVSDWITGRPFERFEPGTVYVVEFWATWCGPCIQSMPHLSEIERRFAGRVRVVGITRTDRHNTPDAIRGMVAEKTHTVMRYAAAIDDAGTTYARFMDASGQDGIPCGFVVDAAGRIAYIGHPNMLDMVLPHVIDGTWGPAARAEVVAVEAELAALWSMGDNPAAMLREFERLESAHPHLLDNMQDAKYMLQLMVGDEAAARATGGALIERAVGFDDHQRLREMAMWVIQTEDGPPVAQLDLALRAAREAVRLTDGGWESRLVLARVLAASGEEGAARAQFDAAMERAPADQRTEIQRERDEP